jgi:hypothetical protein
MQNDQVFIYDDCGLESTSSPANMVVKPSAIWPESMTIAASLSNSNVKE